MSDEPEFHFEVTTAEIEAALKRHDYGWLVENVFTPALAQFLRRQNTNVLINDPRPRTRRQVTVIAEQGDHPHSGLEPVRAAAPRC